MGAIGGPSIVDVEGIEVGHAEDHVALTGCTAVLCRRGAVVGVDVRGAAPATRETDLCRPGTLVTSAHAIVLAGGSAFGLAAAQGAMRYLWERKIGFDAGITPVPIVPAACIFDLGIGRVAWPDEAMGYAACDAASRLPPAQGNVGAGTGATVGKALGMAQATKSGIGSSSVRAGHATVGALVVVNAFGDVWLPSAPRIVAGAREAEGDEYVDTMQLLLSGGREAPPAGTNTTIGVVATDVGLPPEGVNHLASVAHDGLSRVIRPAHTLVDGDTIFALATGTATGDWRQGMPQLEAAAVLAVEGAILAAVEHAAAAGGLPASRFP